MPALIDRLRKLRHTIVPLPIKYGHQFRETFRFLMDNQEASREALEEFQWRRLKELIEYSYEHVPFYRRRFDAAGIQPGDIHNRTEFLQLPTLTREDVDNHFEELKSDEFERLDPIPAVTSGTTRDSMKFFRSRETETWRKAVVWRHYFNMGYRFREPRVELVCPLPFLKDCREMPIDYNENCLMIDPMSITPEHCPRIHERIRRFRPKLLSCHPGTAVSLVDHFQAAGLPPLPIPLICCSGEVLYQEFREAITGFFQGRLFEYYANRENNVAATELSDGRMYVQSDYCYLEFLDQDGLSVQNRQAEIVATSLVNRAFPLIRYLTDDVGIDRGYRDDGIRNFPVMEIIGGRDLLLTRSGVKAPYLVRHLKRLGFDRYRRLQIIQTELDRLVLKVVPAVDYRADEDSRLLEQVCREVVGDEFAVRVELVDDIPPTAACKNQMIVSPLAVEHLRRQRQKWR